jgi:hypothetical protein
MDFNFDKLQEISDKIASGELKPEDVLNQLGNLIDTLPTDEEIISNAQELEKSIEPVAMILTDDEINDILCSYEGEELANRIFWEILKKQGYLDGFFTGERIRQRPDFSRNRDFDKFMEDNDLSDRLLEAKEMLSDNLDLDSLGIKFTGANKKVRNFKIGPFGFEIHIITHKGLPLFFHIAPKKLTIPFIVDSLRKKSKKSKPKKCSDDIYNKFGSGNGPAPDANFDSGSEAGSDSGFGSKNIDPERLIDLLENILDRERSERDANNAFDVSDIVDQVFCEPDFPINPETGEPLFTKEALKSFIEEICLPEDESPIPESLPEDNIEDVSEKINKCLSQAKEIFRDIRENNELRSRYEKAEKDLEEILYHYKIIKNYYNGLSKAFDTKSKAGKKGNPLTLLLPLVLASGEANRFISAVNNFSGRFKDTKKLLSPGKKGYVGIKFDLSFPHGLGKDVEYETVKPEATSDLLTDNYERVDITKLQLGMEFSSKGILGSGNSGFLKSYEDFIVIQDKNPDLPSPFYSFIQDIEGSNKSKDAIIKGIEKDHGYLYSNLIETSANPWLFFNASERGDNDARKSADIKPQSTDQEGEPNESFSNFWGNFKRSFDVKYNAKKAEVEAKILEIKSLSDKFVDKLADYYFTVNLSSSSDNSKMLKSVSDYADSSVNYIEDLLLLIAQKIQELDNQNSPEVLQARASAIDCFGGAANDGSGGGNINADISLDANGTGNTGGGDTLNAKCPPECCGSSGQAFSGGNIIEGLNSPDCPNLFTVCYWKEFAKKATTVGILPLPNGLPPIENPAGFLPNVGLKYWPVGYLPPSFIPLPPPLVNPLDGTPFIRIPMPMIWTVVPPIVIPLPIGVMVIFIPFIGGFMPSPLVFFHDFLTGNSIFLLGIRGFRFIPRKSDPVIPDPLARLKQFLSMGVPNYLFPFPNLGKDNVDDPKRIKKDILSNLKKRLSNVKVNVDFSKIQKIQDDIEKKKESLNAEILDLKRKSPLDGSNPSEKIKELSELSKSFDAQKIEAIKAIMKDYLKSAINVPDIQFPKQSKNLIAEIPSPIKIIRDINSKIKIGAIPQIPPNLVTKVNLKSRILDSVRNIEFKPSSKYADLNKDLPKGSRIVAVFNSPINELDKNKDDLDSLKGLISDGIGQIFSGDKSPLSNKSLLTFKPKLKKIPRIPGAKLPAPGAILSTPNPIVNSVKGFISKNLNVNVQDLIKLSERTSIGNNKVLREKDLQLMIRNSLDKTLSKFPVDLKNVSFPNLANAGNVAQEYSKFCSSLELPPFPPKKSGNPAVPIGPGGIPPIIIPGNLISNFIVEGASSAIDSVDVSKIIPGGLEAFDNLTVDDIKVMGNNIAIGFLNKASIPAIDNLPSIPLESRPQDYIELVMSFLPVHPYADIAFTLLWTKFKSPPRVPIPSEIINQLLNLQKAIIYRLPWPIVVLLGRNIINILNPLYTREDIPRWDRMSLKNPFFVVFLDEFIRSAADISGGFKFFIGAGKLFYPLPTLEINLGFGTKININ